MDYCSVPSAQVVNKYTVANSGRVNIPDRAPKDWTMQGSNNGSTWTTLSTVIGETSWTQGETRTFTFTNSTAYLYYKLDITANNGNAATEVGEIEFIEAQNTATKYQAPITATTNIPTKAYFNKTIDTTLSAEAAGKCKSSTITQIGVL